MFVKRYALVVLLVVGMFAAGAALMDRSVEAMAQAVPAACTIVIDPGHGGEDGGATSCTGEKESTINLEISLRLDDLVHFLGYDTCMIRRDDTAVYTEGDSIGEKKVSDLKHRVDMVNEIPGAVLLSIHQNHFSEERYSGAQVFYAPSEGSLELARKIQAALISSVNPGSKRECKEADSVYLMQKVQCPGVLVECGFLSNEREEELLRTEDYQKKLCCVVAAALCQWRNE